MPFAIRIGNRRTKAGKSARKTPQGAKQPRRPARQTAKPIIRLAAIKAIIQKALKEARKQVEAEGDGMDRLIRALRKGKSNPRKKAG
jgi:hypothetical protein